MDNLQMIGAGTGIQHLRMLAFRKLRRKAIILSLILLTQVTHTQAKEWRDIVPLHSTRADVERLLGPPTIDRSDTTIYEFKTERVYFDYSKDSCAIDPKSWKVPRNTVIRIWVEPKTNQLTFSDLKLDIVKYKKNQDEHVLYVFHYIDETEGVRYEVDESSGLVTLIDHFAAARDQELRCQKPNMDPKTGAIINGAHSNAVGMASRGGHYDKLHMRTAFAVNRSHKLGAVDPNYFQTADNLD